MVDKQIIKQFLTANKNLTLLAVKVPIIKDWTNTIVDEDKINNHNGNLGWVIGDCDLVVDVDPKNGGAESFKRLVEDLNLKLEPSVNTPSGGFHIYLKLDKPYSNLKKNVNSKYKGIDFLSKGSQCVIPSSKTLDGEYVWSDDLLDCFHQTQAPESLIKLLTNHNIDVDTNNGDNSNDDLGDFKGLINESSENGWSKERVEELLSKLDASMGNDNWVKVGMALHDWNTLDGLELWEKWSKGGTNYNDGDTYTRWQSFKLGGGVTLGTISHMAKSVEYDEEYEKVEKFISIINDSDEKQLQFDVYDKIKKLTFTTINKEKIVKAIQDRLKVLTNVKMPIKDVRKIVDSDRVVSGHFIEDLEVPEWCKKWVYVNSHGGFVSVNNFQVYKSESFNLKNGVNIPLNDSDNKCSATKYVSDNGLVKIVDAMHYAPLCKDNMLTINGLSVLNSFNINTIPLEDEETTDKGSEAIKFIENHILNLICSKDVNNAKILTQWLAHQVQHSGKLMLWSPVIQSIAGIGKSFIGELLRQCLGDINVGTVSPKAVMSENNGWATGVLVNLLEELKITGHSRYDSANAVKPLLTDRIIQIHDKYVKRFNTYNVTNYICFTNFKDCIPLEESDRRWWVIFSDIPSLDVLSEYVGENKDTYFPKLFDYVRNNGGQIRKWLLDYKISKEFLNTKQAPMTDYKKYMIATESSGIDGLDEIKEMIETGGKYFCKDVISSADLFEAVKFEYPDLEDFKTTQRNIILKKLGYMKIPNPIHIDGKVRRCWAKNPIENNQVRLLLNNK